MSVTVIYSTPEKERNLEELNTINAKSGKNDARTEATNETSSRTCQVCGPLHIAVFAAYDGFGSLESKVKGGFRTTNFYEVEKAASDGCLFCDIVLNLSCAYATRQVSRPRVWRWSKRPVTGPQYRATIGFPENCVPTAITLFDARSGQIDESGKRVEPGNCFRDSVGRFAEMSLVAYYNVSRKKAGIHVVLPEVENFSLDGQHYGAARHGFEIYTLTGNASNFPSLRTAHLVERNPRSSNVWENVKAWNEECRHSHAKCDRNDLERATLPSRVIDIETLLNTDEAYVNVVDTGGKLGRYIALSYCRGKCEVYLTTKSTAERPRKPIRVSELPLTIRDAIDVARYLGIRYIWVDSLCIIQDDPDDWDKEARKMFQVYGNADLVIGAVCASSADAGFLHVRDSDVLEHTYTQTDSEGRTSTFLAQSTDFYLTTHQGFLSGTLSRKNENPGSKTPLLYRAWGVQERLAARAVLQFCETEIIWECREKTSCECRGLWGISPVPAIFEHKPKQIITKTGYQQLLKWAAAWPIEIRNACWQVLVSSYAQNKLSRETDRLIAVSALVNTFEDEKLGTYLAGLWSNFIFEGFFWLKLGWFPEDPQTRARPLAEVPSWSWASACPGIYYLPPKPRSYSVQFVELLRRAEQDPVLYRPLLVFGKALTGIVHSRPTAEDRDGVRDFVPLSESRRKFAYMHPVTVGPYLHSDQPLRSTSFFFRPDFDLEQRGAIGSQVKLLWLAHEQTPKSTCISAPNMSFPEMLPALPEAEEDNALFDPLSDRSHSYLVMMESPEVPGAWERIGLIGVGYHFIRAPYWPNLMQETTWRVA